MSCHNRMSPSSNLGFNHSRFASHVKVNVSWIAFSPETHGLHFTFTPLPFHWSTPATWLKLSVDGGGVTGYWGPTFYPTGGFYWEIILELLITSVTHTYTHTHTHTLKNVLIIWGGAIRQGLTMQTLKLLCLGCSSNSATSYIGSQASHLSTLSFNLSICTIEINNDIHIPEIFLRII